MLCACYEDNQHFRFLIVATLSYHFLRGKEKLLALEVSQQSHKGHNVLIRVLQVPLEGTDNVLHRLFRILFIPTDNITKAWLFCCW